MLTVSNQGPKWFVLAASLREFAVEAERLGRQGLQQAAITPAGNEAQTKTRFLEIGISRQQSQLIPQKEVN
jgi:hypothetical protein